jgi:hypothetical protein
MGYLDSFCIVILIAFTASTTLFGPLLGNGLTISQASAGFNHISRPLNLGEGKTDTASPSDS